jgi:hypothetical protein
MDRNVITVAQAATANAEQAAAAKARRSALLHGLSGGKHLDDMSYVDDLLGDEEAGQEKLSPDAWYARLVKLIPSEALSLYLALDRAVRPPTNPEADAGLVYWLAACLAVCLLFNLAYLRRVWHVNRVQLIVSTVALVAYVYVTGGVFDVLGWANPKAQSFVLIVTAAGLSLFKPPEVTKPSDAIGANPRPAQ